MEQNFKSMLRDRGFCFRAPKELIDGLQEIADARIRTLSTIIVFALAEWLEDQQDKEVE